MVSSSLKVKNLLCPLTNKWNIEQIRKYLRQYEDIILRIKTSSTQAPDTVIWLPEKSGEYSTKTGYGLVMTTSRPTGELNELVNWLRDIWNVKTSPKIKDYLWRLVKRAIPVSSNLERRGFPRFNCKKCDAHEDDLHVFLHCLIAQEVWNLTPTVQRPPISVVTIADLIKLGRNFIPLPSTGLIAPL